jgi:hypothetical protein
MTDKAKPEYLRLKHDLMEQADNKILNRTEANTLIYDACKSALSQK